MLAHCNVLICECIVHCLPARWANVPAKRMEKMNAFAAMRG